MPASPRLQILRQAPADLVEDQPHQWLGPADVGGRHHEIERDRSLALDEVADAPVAAARHLRHDGIAIETKERHRRGQYTRALVLALVEQFPRRGGDDRMRPGVAKMS